MSAKPTFIIGDAHHEAPTSVTEALIYADGLAVNVDAGMYRGSNGFVYELP